jgi:hypothetical protein
MARLALFLTILAAVAISSARAGWWPWSDDSPECEFTCEQVVECVSEYVDTDSDGVVTIEELDAARARYTSNTEQVASWFASWFTDATNSATIASNCDTNGDGRLTPSDFAVPTKKCLPNQHDRCMIKDVCDKAAQAARSRAL